MMNMNKIHDESITYHSESWNEFIERINSIIVNKKHDPNQAKINFELEYDQCYYPGDTPSIIMEVWVPKPVTTVKKKKKKK